jgi:hypothetical protein
VAGAVLGGVAFLAGNDRRTTSRQLEQVLRCVESPQCRLVRLTGTRGAAVAMVQRDSVRLVVDGLPRNNRAEETYVLWQSTPSGTMKAVTAFDVTSAARQLLDPKPLVAPVDRSAVFAVSRERGRTAPPTPSQPLLTGTVA